MARSFGALAPFFLAALCWAPGCASQAPTQDPGVLAPSAPPLDPSAPAPLASAAASGAQPGPLAAEPVTPTVREASVTGIIGGAEQIVAHGTFNPSGNVVFLSCITVRWADAARTSLVVTDPFIITLTTVSESETTIHATFPAPIADPDGNTTDSCNLVRVRSALAGAVVEGPFLSFPVILSPVHARLNIEMATIASSADGMDRYVLDGSFVRADAPRFADSNSANTVFLLCNSLSEPGILFSGFVAVTTESAAQIAFQAPHAPPHSLCQISTAALLDQPDDVSNTVYLVTP